MSNSKDQYYAGECSKVLNYIAQAQNAPELMRQELKNLNFAANYGSELETNYNQDLWNWYHNQRGGSCQ